MTESEKRDFIKDKLVNVCGEGHRVMFACMYAKTPYREPKHIINIVDSMEKNKLDWAISQIENTISKIEKSNNA